MATTRVSTKTLTLL